LLSLPSAEYLDWYKDTNTKKIIITDRAFNHLHKFSHNDTTYNSNLVLPGESVFKFGDDVAGINGNWELSVSSYNSNFRGQINYKLSIYSIASTHPYSPPSININSDKKIQLIYPNTFQRNNYKIVFSPKINNMINFTTYSKYDSAIQSNVLTFPHLEMIANNLVTITQQKSSYSQLSNLSRIGVFNYGTIKTSDSELSANRVNDSLLTDFIVETSQDDNSGTYIYTQESKPWRLYQLTSSDSLSSLAFSVEAIYNDGSRKVVPIPPGAQGLVRLSFFSYSY
jgi:hypothetical protein